jgi:hypothetical protein
MEQGEAAPADPAPEEPRVLKHHDKVRIGGQLYDVATVVGFVQRNRAAGDNLALAVAREFQRGISQGWKPQGAWIEPSGVLLCDCPDCPTRRAQNEAQTVRDGEVVLIDGIRWKVVGDSVLAWGPAKLVCVEWS